MLRIEEQSAQEHGMGHSMSASGADLGQPSLPPAAPVVPARGSSVQGGMDRVQRGFCSHLATHANVAVNVTTAGTGVRTAGDSSKTA